MFPYCLYVFIDDLPLKVYNYFWCQQDDAPLLTHSAVNKLSIHIPN